ncbi:PQQ-binding-like beta-propeller repeat protein [Rubinisphaera sp.]|uniref:outer membrane protein assembly factor BamB family protein n=1 Tax=Rubinisphaera sp. TaxID=2024857 RepID=UPI000C0F9973|nr:PQQ-binding-like beta-propeller repeat protein [Rubinisphaera sp.]MBV11630.1 serine/threonine protein kinase [Rubinisphaera sp.]|tara:strand:- start:15691 stop:17007 length:1317 start_codon:yes stop_codon:yes gene_type:complete
MHRLFSWMLTLCLTAGVTQAADEWPQFRGPDGNGHAENAELPTHWSETENVRWKVPVAGEGFSSPVISGNQIWLTTAIVEPLSAEEEEAKLAQLANPRGIQFGGPLTLKAIAYDVATGKMLHDVVCFQFPGANPKHATNSYASPTPVISEGRLYCHFGDYGTCCIDAESGELLWQNQELHVDHQNGPGSSPVLWNDLLIIHFDGIDFQFLAAMNKDDGRVVWKTDRSGEMNPKPEMKKAYGTPTIQAVNGKDQIISPAANWVYGYDPATGKELWKAGYGQLGFSTVPKPVVGNGMAYVCTSFMQSRLVAVKYDGTGDVTESHVVWTADRQIPKTPSLLLVENDLFFVGDAGIATMLDAKTGDQVWQERFPGQYSASPLLANGNIYVSNKEGVTTVFKSGKTFELVAENTLDTGCMGSAAVKGNELFMRTTTHLYCIAE